MVALRNLLLVGSGCLEIRKGTAGMDVFRQCVTFCGKAGSPTSNPLWLKVQSRQLFVGLQQSHTTTESTITVLQQILETTTA